MKARCGKSSRHAKARPAGQTHGPGFLTDRDYKEQVASMQDCPLPHCVSSWHCGLTSPGVSQ
jgi:hypothetical protein